MRSLLLTTESATRTRCVAGRQRQTLGTMSPKTVGALSKFSHLMSLQSTLDIEQLIRSDFVALIADAIDTAAINGSGSSNQPLGILNTSGIGSVAGGTNGAAPTLDNLLDLKQEVAVDNADVASCGFLTNTKVESVLGKLKDSQGQYLLSPYGAELGRSQIGGRRFEVYPCLFDRAAGVGLFPRPGERHPYSSFRRPVLIQPSALLISRF